MPDIVIKAENIGKKYTIGHQAENGRYVALRDVLMHNARTLWNKTKDLATGKAIIQGDTLYIKNPEPHHRAFNRSCDHQGSRVASLLEVGTGFHPELTGL